MWGTIHWANWPKTRILERLYGAFCSLFALCSSCRNEFCYCWSWCYPFAFLLCLPFKLLVLKSLRTVFFFFACSLLARKSQELWANREREKLVLTCMGTRQNDAHMTTANRPFFTITHFVSMAEVYEVTLGACLMQGEVAPAAPVSVCCLGVHPIVDDDVLT
jgi:hypothetical protein